jgi:hypothetical protein
LIGGHARADRGHTVGGGRCAIRSSCSGSDQRNRKA